jgi:ATP-dependent RNA helicase DeaD
VKKNDDNKSGKKSLPFGAKPSPPKSNPRPVVKKFAAGGKPNIPNGNTPFVPRPQKTNRPPKSEWTENSPQSNDAPRSPIERKKKFAPKSEKPERGEPKVAIEKIAAEEVVETPLPTFAELGLPDALLAAITNAGFESPTPIQARAIPLLLEGKDIIGQAQTGTGKTAAFALPLLARIDVNAPGTQALVLVPTRELAIQAAEQIHALAGKTGLRVVPVYGGQPIDRQFRALMNPPAVVVGTPGRLMDHMRRGSVKLDNVSFCAIDEADEMLAFGFIEDIETILAELPKSRQTALFSATLPPAIAALIKKFLPGAQRVEIVAKQRTVDSVRQSYYEVAPGKKREALARILDMETPGPTIIFCRTRRETQELAESLSVRGYDAEALNGEMMQSERDRVMKKFKEGQADILVATDVAARGIDIDSVTHVINFDLPFDVEQYIHRIGRTGRAGREGDALSLIEPRDRRTLLRFEYQIGTKISPLRVPTAADIAVRRREVFGSTLADRLDAGNFDGQLALVSDLAERYDVANIAAAALQLLWEAGNSASGGNARESELSEELAAQREQPEVGMVRLFVSLGRADQMRPADLVGAIIGETGLPARSIGTIEVLDRITFFEIPAAHAELVTNALSNTKIRGRRPKVGPASPR